MAATDPAASLVTEPFYATDPDQSPPRGRPGDPARGIERDGGVAEPRPASAERASPIGHYPWSIESRQTAAQSSHSGFLRLLYNGLRAILLLPVRPAAINAGAGSCMALVALVTLIGVVGEWWLIAEPADRFNWHAVRSAWFDLPIIVLGGAWLAQPRGPGLFARNRVPIISATPTPLLHFAAVMLSASAWILAIAYGLLIAIAAGLLPEDIGETIGTWLYLAAPLWSYLVAARTVVTMHRAAPISVTRRLVVLAMLAVATAWSLVDPPESYWEEPLPQGPVNYVASDHTRLATVQ